ncbi:MAG: FAD-binding protein, partial [Acidimicrobiaceae bacterium]|nr:FAD-binding protein [Acidimicrobiaceae bacterium]
MSSRLEEFAAAVGTEGPVCVRGGGTQWDVGGPPAPGVREVAAPAGVVHHEPAEMVVRVNAGTTLADLQDAVGQAGQWVPLDAPEPQRATVGGLLAVGRAGYRRLRYGPVRDVLLEARFVTAEGSVAKAGAPLVKNVTGFDVCRLLVGSLGTLGLLGEVVLRCLPVPQVTRWWASRSADPFDTWAALYRPSAVLWDGTSTWVALEGEAVEVVHQAASVLGSGWEEVPCP